MHEAGLTGSVTAVHGDCDARFERVRGAFARNFAEHDELGAAVCVFVDGEPVVDLWGGVADVNTGQPWERDTMNVLMSCSKGVTALCGHILIDRGQLDPDAPIARYWPEFAQKGKQDIPVRMAFNHQSGVAHVNGVIPYGRLADFDHMVRLTAETRPFWEPGTRTGYHAVTIGWIIGELIRRISGKTPGTFLREEVTGPLGDLDCWIGLPQEHEHRVAQTVMFDMAAEVGIPPRAWQSLIDPTSLGHKAIARLLTVPPVRTLLAAVAVKRAEAGNPGQGMPSRLVRSLLDPSSAAFAFLTNLGGYYETANTRFSYANELPAAGAIATARALAGIYAPLSLGGSHNGVRIVSEEAIARMQVAQSATEVDAVLGGPTAYSLGFAKSWPSSREGSGMIIGEDAFGTPGAGGQMGFADPSYRLAFAYVMNRHGAGTGLNRRGQSLVDATYESLGSPGRTARYWRKPSPT